MQKEAAMTIPRHHTREKKENSSLPSPAELLEQYAALIWKICSIILHTKSCGAVIIILCPIMECS